MARTKGTRHAEPADTLLVAAVNELKRTYTKAQILSAVDQVFRVSPLSDEVTREQKAALARLIDQLQGVWDKHGVFGFLGRQKAGGVPVTISIEILERIVATRAVNPWAMVSKIMAEDYPSYKWGRS